MIARAAGAAPRTGERIPRSRSSPDFGPDFAIPPEGLAPEAIAVRLQALRDLLDARRRTMVGLQANQDLQFDDLAPFLNISLNNVGDPHSEGIYPLHSRQAETAVLDYYAQLWHAPSPWGYVLSMGATEANMYALWNARENLSQWCEAFRPRAKEPVLFTSEEAHYSLLKAAQLAGIATFAQVGRRRYPQQCPISTRWPDAVPTAGGLGQDGTVDVGALEALVEFFASRRHPVVVAVNYGSAQRGAYDDIPEVCKRLRPIFKRSNLVGTGNAPPERSNGYWIHVDGALGATYMPYLESAFDLGLISERGPVFDFRLDEVCSISASGHKYPGSPVPCGIYMTRARLRMRRPAQEATGAADNTFGGSRSGLAPLILWLHLARQSHQQHVDTAMRCLRAADRIEAGLRRLSDRLQSLGHESLHVARGRQALCVIFRRPRRELVTKYALGLETIPIGDRLKQFARVYAMPHVNEELIDELLDDLGRTDAFDSRA